MAENRKYEVGTISIFEGIGKESGKPYKGLLLEVGEWSKLYFPESRFEMDYMVSYAVENGLDEDNKVPVNGK